MRDTSEHKKWIFRIFKAIPFLWEMKVITDWTVTKTSLDLFQWFRLDDVSHYLYFNKYMADWRRKRTEYEEMTTSMKFLYGVLFNFGLIILILLPIVLFSGINPTLANNPVISGSLSISFELMNNGKMYSIFSSDAFNMQDLPTD
jgi:hypothetical protein